MRFGIVCFLLCVSCLCGVALADPDPASQPSRASFPREMPPPPPTPPGAPPGSMPGPRVEPREGPPRGPIAPEFLRPPVHPPRMEKAAYLGISVSPATAALRQQLKLPKGVGLVVDFIEPGSPAEQSGLKEYDVLQKLNDQLLIDPHQFMVLVRMFKAGEEVKLSILRDGQSQSISSKLVEREMPALEERGPISSWDWTAPAPVPPLGAPGPRGPGQEMPSPMMQRGPLPSITFASPKVSMTFTFPDGKLYLMARRLDQSTHFAGFVDTPEEQQKLPEDMRERMQQYGLLVPHPGSVLFAGEVAAAAGKKIGRGDLLSINVSDLQGPGVQTFKTARVDEKGEILLPYVKIPTRAEGLTPPELEEAIVKAYRDANLVQKAQVSVSIVEPAPATRPAPPPATRRSDDMG